MIYCIQCHHITWKKIIFKYASTLSYFCIQSKRQNFVKIPLFTTAEKTIFFRNLIFFIWISSSKNGRLWTTGHLQVFLMWHLSHCLKSHFVFFQKRCSVVFQHDPVLSHWICLYKIYGIWLIHLIVSYTLKWRRTF